MPNRFVIGIDPGKTTGVAIWDRQKRSFHMIISGGIVQAMDIVLKHSVSGGMEVWFEDARQRKWFGEKGREALQGAGSIKRECAIWEEFLKHFSIPFKMIPPKANNTKLTHKQFQKLTKWGHQTNEHTRDAGMLVFGA